MRLHLQYSAILAASIVITDQRDGRLGLSWLDAWLDRRDQTTTALVNGYLSTLTNYQMMVVCDSERQEQILAGLPEDLRVMVRSLLHELRIGVT